MSSASKICDLSLMQWNFANINKEAVKLQTKLQNIQRGISHIQRTSFTL